jgi:hypothetical protein
MRNSCLIMALAASCLLGLANTVTARVFPGGGGGAARAGSRPVVAAALRNNDNGGYGDYGGGVTYNFSSGPTGIGMQPGPPPSTGPRQAPVNPNWWYQNQSQPQPMAGQQAQSNLNSPYASFLFEAFHYQPKAAMDIIQWPILLQRPAFLSRRTQIEAPYRRSPPDLSVPTAEDYYAIAKTSQEMEDMLEGLLQEGPLDTDEYEQAKTFLNTIEQQARERSEPGGTSPKLES